MQSLTAWIACLAILLSALAPSISHALSTGSRSSGWLEICSVNKTSKFVKIADDLNPAAPHDKNLHTTHCPFCSTHTGSMDLPPTAIRVLPAAIVTQILVPPLYYQSSRPLFVWAGAQSRAPPTAS